MRVTIRIVLASAAALMAASAPAASADVVALAQKLGPGTDNIDLAKVDLSTGAFLQLPSGVNSSTLWELHPSVTAEGKRVVFERRSPDGTTDRIVMADLTTGQTADLFNGFEVASTHPTSPSITPDGNLVLTGAPFDTFMGQPISGITQTDVTAFPNGPYPHSTVKSALGFGADNTRDPVAGGPDQSPLVAFTRISSAGQRRLVLAPFGGTASTVLQSATLNLEHPAIGTPGGQPTVVFDERPAAGGTRDIAFRPADTSSFSGTPTALTAVDTAASESRPAFTPDGRYLAFIRTGSDNHERVLLWDSQTQTILNAPGADLGQISTSTSGSLGVYEQRVLSFTGITVTGLVNFNLLSSSGVGILVQRVIGHHKLFGHTVPTLKLIGRVPFGKFAKGRRHAHWNFAVNGKRLRRGTYQVTVRAVTPSLKIRDLGTPRIIHIH